MKFSIVTPAYNSMRFIRETIESVLLQQGEFEIEYHVQDGGSTDDTLSILKEYEHRVQSGEYGTSITFTWTSEPDKGMYDAINKGFARLEGDIYAWINSDDLYEPGAFAVIAKALNAYPEIDWIKGMTTNIDADGVVVRKPIPLVYNRAWLQKGAYGMQAYFVEQDSVFWRAKLWKQSGPIPTEYKVAGDYWLWIQFAQHVPLSTIDTPVSRFRKLPGQLGGNITRYKNEQKTIQGVSGTGLSLVRIFFALRSRTSSVLPSLEPFFQLLFPFFFPQSTVEYLSLQDSHIEKRTTRSYVAQLKS